METYIDALEWERAIDTISGWAERRESRFVTVCNVHSVVTAKNNRALQDAINSSDMATPDGMPIAWLIERRTKRRQERISGMEITLALCAAAEARGIVVSFYGSQSETLSLLESSLHRRFPSLKIGEMISPPYRSQSAAELAADTRALNDSGAGIVFIGLGCPKQEIWMHQNRGIEGVQIGIGAAFDFIAGTVNRPPVWMQLIGLEWLGRLLSEPRRLWRRYLVTNSVFLAWLAQQAISRRRNSNQAP